MYDFWQGNFPFDKENDITRAWRAYSRDLDTMWREQIALDFEIMRDDLMCRFEYLLELQHGKLFPANHSFPTIFDGYHQ